jgi:hypothetical protein
MTRKSSIIQRLVLFFIALASLHFASLLHAQGSAISQIQSPKIRIDNVSGEWADLTRKVNALESTKCNGQYVSLNAGTTVEAFVGGRVKDIRVIRFVGVGNSATRKEVRNRITRVWRGKLKDVSCYLGWDEGTYWSIEAIVEFEDGKRGALITDGFHVAMQDHAGKTWFVRLFPATQ